MSLVSKAPSKSLDFMILSLVPGLRRALYQKQNYSQFTLLNFPITLMLPLYLSLCPHTYFRADRGISFPSVCDSGPQLSGIFILHQGLGNEVLLFRVFYAFKANMPYLFWSLNVRTEIIIATEFHVSFMRTEVTSVLGFIFFFIF